MPSWQSYPRTDPDVEGIRAGSFGETERLGHARPERRRSLVAFASFAIAALGFVIAVASPVEELSERSFSVHMVQHLLFAFVVPPFLLLFLAEALAPATGRAGRGGEGSRPLASVPVRGLSAAVDILSRPVPILAVSTAVLWGWHLPALYDLALRDGRVHVLEHASFLAAYLLFWRPLVGVSGRPPFLASRAARAACLLVGAMQMAALGALITFSDRVLYGFYLDVADPLLDPLLDQQVGGAIMWFSGPIVFGIAAFLTMGGGPSVGRQGVQAFAKNEAISSVVAASMAPGGLATTGLQAEVGSRATTA